MRFAIDLQACQWGGARAHHALALARALRRQAGAHALVFVVRGGVDVDAAWLQRQLKEGDEAELDIRTFLAPLPSAACDPANAWRTQAAGHMHTAYLAALAVDAILLLDTALGYDDDGIFGAPDPAGPPVLAVVREAPTATGDAERLAWWTAWRDALGGCAAVFAPPGVAVADAVVPVALPADDDAAASQLLSSLRDAALARSPEPLPECARPRLAYVSPLPPAASGIADYSAELLPALAAHYDIVVICPPPAPTADIADAFPVRSPAWLDAHAGAFDRILYHVGNSPFHGHMVGLLRRHPGVVVLHDFYLGHLFGYAQHSGTVPMALWRALLRSHGYAALQHHRERGEAAALSAYPCNLEIFGQADGVIVHSQHAHDLARTWAGPTPPCPVSVVPLAHASPPLASLGPTARAAARARLGLAADAFVVCSFGYAGDAKMSRELVDAWIAAGLDDARLVLVGGHQFEGEYSHALEARIGLNPTIELTGYAPLDVYRDYLAAADVAVQLRRHSRGETSRAVLDAMAHGVAVLANAHGSAAELPADAAWLLPDAAGVADIAEALRTLAHDASARAARVAAASRYVRGTHDPATVAVQYRDAIESAALAGPRTAAGRARGVVAALAHWRDPLVAPTRAEAQRLSRQLLANHPQPQARGVPVDVGQLAVLPARPVGASARGLRVLSLQPAGTPDPRVPRDERLAAMAQVCAAADITWDVVQWAVAADDDAPDATVVRIPALPDVAGVPRRLTQALAVLTGAAEAVGLAPLIAQLRATGYDAIHLETPFALPLLRHAWAQVPNAGALPPIIYDARVLEAVRAQAVGVPPAVRQAIADAEADAVAQAGLIVAATADVRAGLVRQGAKPWRVVVLPDGATPPAEDPARSLAVYRDHLPQRPFALWVSEDDAGARQGFLDLMGNSFAYLPPGACIVVAGRLCDFLEHSPAFNAWSGINRARVRLMADADELMLSGARRHAHLVLLARAPAAGNGGPDPQAAQALRDGLPILATPAALAGMSGLPAWPDLTLAASPAQLRAQLLAMLHAPARTREPMPPLPWLVTLRAWPQRLAALVDGARRLACVSETPSV